MQVKNESGLRAEMRIIPAWAWALAAIGFLFAQVFCNIVIPRHSNAPPCWARLLMGLLVGLVLAGFLLVIGYINRDAKRRGMSPALWTIVAIIIPNALGIILYFLLRHPLQDACPQCGSAVQTGFNFCPRCSCKLSPSCPQCQRLVSINDVYCPYCGTSLHTPSAPASGLPTG